MSFAICLVYVVNVKSKHRRDCMQREKLKVEFSRELANLENDYKVLSLRLIFTI